MQSLVLAYLKIKIGCMICLFWFLKIVRIKYIDNFDTQIYYMICFETSQIH